MSYLIRIDSKTQDYVASSAKYPAVTGIGHNLSAAVDDLKMKIATHQDAFSPISKAHDERLKISPVVA